MSSKGILILLGILITSPPGDPKVHRADASRLGELHHPSGRRSDPKRRAQNGVKPPCLHATHPKDRHGTCKDVSMGDVAKEHTHTHLFFYFDVPHVVALQECSTFLRALLVVPIYGLVPMMYMFCKNKLRSRKRLLESGSHPSVSGTTVQSVAHQPVDKFSHD